jgi:hypothetical protein
VVRFGKENSWGYTRILGELRKLGIKSISRQTVKGILKENDIDPGPKRGNGSWDEFLKIHADTQWQCGFVSKPMWTTRGLVAPDFLGGLPRRSDRRSKWSKPQRQIIEPSMGSPLAGVESVCAAFRDKVPLVPSVTANCSNDATATS